MEKLAEEFSHNKPVVVKGAYAKDVHYLLDFSLTALKQLHLALCMCKIDYDGTKAEEMAASDFLTKELFPLVEQIVKGSDGNQSNS